MTSQHTDSSFDRDLEGLQIRLVTMSRLVDAAIGNALKVLETRDLELSRKVRRDDKMIDEMDEDRPKGDTTAYSATGTDAV
ncbi:PhoU domain-containing protein [Aquicoccus porphyridii]|uniref:PhoU domain-containing protein n=1 Tax=Aquicoccus porphyridii TaxID=1852029 RepID=UPI00273DAC47|nr:PhoU domain-containing protein [Aquicoccus porphyridii]